MVAPPVAPPAAPPPAARCLASQALKAPGASTRTGARIVAWPRPQSSVQISENVPVFVGVTTISVWIPGTTSCFWPICGIQNEWITSAEVMSNFTCRWSGITSSSDRTLPGYSNRQANCCAKTLTRKGLAPASAFFESTTALTTPIEITRIAGTTVQITSSLVFPWIGGPSVSSSGCARNAITQ